MKSLRHAADSQQEKNAATSAERPAALQVSAKASSVISTACCNHCSYTGTLTHSRSQRNIQRLQMQAETSDLKPAS